MELKTQLVAMMEKKVASLEARMEVQYNEVYKETTSILQKMKNQVAVVCES